MITTSLPIANGRLFGLIPDPSLSLRVRVTNGDAKPGWYLERTLAWTGYAIETIVDDALHAGLRGHVEITVPSEMSFASIAWLEGQFAHLRRRGVAVDILVSGRT